jgi:type VI secretion system secreted protein VgrG
MEEEGIFYFFEHTEDAHKLVMADVSSVHEPTPWKSTIPFRDAGLGVGDQEQVSRFRYSVQIRHGAVTLRDFDFKKPSLKVENAKAADIENDLEWYDYPGEYTELSTGKDLAEVRLQEFRSERALGLGEGNCTHLVSGYKFTLEDHPWADMNQEWVILRLQHWGSQPQAAEEQAGSGEQSVYQNSFECVPYSVPYRPRRWTPRPVVDGPQTAIVVGPAGEEIHTDEYGRVKVQFHWDRAGQKDDKSSCWIRVSQGWGGAGYGMVIIPRIGHEVVVDFLEGDPDQPLIVGRVYNGESPPPYGLPGAKTMSSFKSNSSPGGGGSNELRFEDAAGSEEVYLHAQKDENIVVENNRTKTVKVDESFSIGHDQTGTVGHDQTLSVTNNQSITVGVDRTKQVGANQSETVGANKTIQVGGSHTESISGTKTETVTLAAAETIGLAKALSIGAAYQVSVGAAMNETVGGAKMIEVGGYYSRSVAVTESIDVGSSSKLSVGGAYKIEVGGDMTESVGADLAVTAADGIAISGKKISIEASDELTITVGSAKLQMKKNGDITLNGKALVIKGSGDVTIKGSTIKQN